MSCSEKKGVADCDSFWVKIERKDTLLSVNDDEFVAEAETEMTKEGKFKKTCEYHIVAVHEDIDGKLGEERQKQTLTEFSGNLKHDNEFITEMKSVEMHFVRVQTEEEIKQGRNRMCPVNSTWVWCR